MSKFAGLGETKVRVCESRYSHEWFQVLHIIKSCFMVFRGVYSFFSALLSGVSMQANPVAPAPTIFLASMENNRVCVDPMR